MSNTARKIRKTEHHAAIEALDAYLAEPSNTRRTKRYKELAAEVERTSFKHPNHGEVTRPYQTRSEQQAGRRWAKRGMMDALFSKLGYTGRRSRR